MTGFNRILRGACVVLAFCAASVQHVFAIQPLAPARVLPIAKGFSGSSINVVANRRHALFTHGHEQFAAFYDIDGYVVLAHRTLGTEQWRTQRARYRGNTADAHNSISLAVDGDGYLHVAWDHHGGALNYARSTRPLSLELGAKLSMTGRAQERVTYPEFYLLPEGDLLCLYREGSSGRGSLVVNRYNTREKRWHVVASNLLDGEGGRSPYWGASVDRNGGLHLAWMWRDSPDVASNHDIAYAFSPDGAGHWRSIDGETLNTPFTAANSPYAARIDTHRNLMNSPWVTADWRGRPYIASYWSASAAEPPQFRVLRHDGMRWRNEQITARSGSFSLAGTATRRPPISRGVFLVEGWNEEPPAHLIYRDDDRGGRVMLLSTPQIGSGEWAERELTRDSLGAWEPAIDPVQWVRLQQLHLLVQSVSQRDGNDTEPAAANATHIASLIVSPREIRIANAPKQPARQRTAVSKPDIEPDEVIDLMRRVADWQLANPPNVDPRGWEIAPFYLGTLALHRVSGDERYRDAIVERGEANGWQPGERTYHADDHAVMQAYLELHREMSDPAMIAPSRKRLDEILAHPAREPFRWNAPHSQKRWDWCDALFMAPMSWLLMWEATGEERYLDFMNREWWATTEHLYSPEVGWYFRDESFIDQREPNGKQVHWSRGNGWVIAGLARVLDVFPRDHADRPRYEKLYREMTQAALAAQQPDGMWRAGLLDPTTHTAREATGTAFMTFALAWGVNRGMLPREHVAPAVLRGWAALSASVQPDGRLADCQPVGDAPLGFDPSHTEPFGVGAFLLAGSEVHRMVNAQNR
jgi:rhamnogalacturonyl hydrolase YesR